ncbi:MAG: ribbon-helix-helix domain-containing protein [Nitrososphaerota archaeon]
MDIDKTKKGRGQFSTISLPTPLVKEVEKVVSQLGYWPAKTDFVREAVVEKLQKHKKELGERTREGVSRDK